ncbi:MAG: hypothetical protein AAGG79_05690 [Pseudomonadota bacterium]
MRACVIALVFFGVTACAPMAVNLDEGPYYTEGFSDGCRTAEARRAAFDNRSFRNDDLFAAQESYRSGFRRGFRECQPVGQQPLQPTLEGAADSIL